MSARQKPPDGLTLVLSEEELREVRRVMRQQGRLGVLSTPIFQMQGSAGDAVGLALEDEAAARAAYEEAYRESERARRRLLVVLSVVSGLLGVALAVIGMLLLGRR